MKTVIYKAFGVYCTTNEENYYAMVRDANQVQSLKDFDSADEIIAYYCKYCGSKPEDFVVIEE